VDLGTTTGRQVIEGAVAGGHAGAWIHIGDLTGDYFNKELIVGTPDVNNSTGAVRVFLRRAGAPDLTTAGADATFLGAAAGDRFGAAADAGYVTNLEIPLVNRTPVGPIYPRDLIVGAPGAHGGRGAAYVFSGAVSRTLVRNAAEAAFTIMGAAPGDNLGSVIESADLNGDGYREVVLAVPSRGLVYAIDLRKATSPTVDLSVAVPGTVIAGLGNVIALGSGDVNDDGAVELVIGDPTAQSGRGSVYFFDSRMRVLPASMTVPGGADATLTGAETGDRFGAAVWVADIDDDAEYSADVIIGAPGADGVGNARPDAGEVHIVWGGPNLAATFRSGLALHGAAAGHQLGARVTAGNVTRKAPFDTVMLAPGANGGFGEVYVYYGRHTYEFPSTGSADMATAANRRIISDETVGAIQTIRVWETTAEGAEEVVVGVPSATTTSGAQSGRVYLPFSPRLDLSSNSVTLRAARCVPGVQAFEIRNPSDVPVPWRLYNAPSWVEIQPATGVSSLSGPGQVKLVARTTDLTPGTYSQRVEILSNGPHLGHTAAITINLTVDPPAPTAASAHVDFTGDGCGDVVTFRPSSGSWRVVGGTDVQLGQAGDIPVPGDYNGDWIADPAVYRPSDSTWRFGGGNVVSFGQVGDIPVPADYNGDGRMEIAVYRPGSATWIGQTFSPIVWGQVGELPVAADYNGDGRADLAVFDRATGTWKVRGVGTFRFGELGDLPVPADYNGDGRVDMAVYHRQTGTWRVDGQFEVAWGAASDIPFGLDVDRDGKADLAVFDRATNTWRAYHPVTGVTTTQATGPGELPAFGAITRRVFRATRDTSGDGQTDIGVWRPGPGVWFLKTSQSGYAQWSELQWGSGAQGDQLVPGDYDGDGAMDAAVWRPGNGVWCIRKSSSGFTSDLYVQWGSAALGDIPVPADYDGDGRTDVAVWRPGNGVWFVRTSSTGYASDFAVQWGAPGDRPIAADFDGDGKADIAVWRPSNGVWFLRHSSAAYQTTSTYQWGAGSLGDVPVAGDYDGDGRADIAVWRRSNGFWFVRRSTTGYASAFDAQWGAGALGDVPIVGDYDGDGRADLTVWRPGPGVWFVKRSNSNYAQAFSVQWGAGSYGDVPIR
jgi:hypothetical protein